MTIQIEEGKFYRRADGSVHGPARPSPSDRFPWWVSLSQGGDALYTDQGAYYYNQESVLYDLVAEVSEQDAHDAIARADVEKTAARSGFAKAGLEPPAWAAAVESEAAQESRPFAVGDMVQSIPCPDAGVGEVIELIGTRSVKVKYRTWYGVCTDSIDTIKHVEPIASADIEDDGFVTREPLIRQFSTGASRDQDVSKLDFEGFLSPTVLNAFAAYMHKNRQMADGSLRDSDNWQKGIPDTAYMKSMWRHFFDVWALHRGADVAREDMEAALCGLLFNAMGYLHEHLKSKA